MVAIMVFKTLNLEIFHNSLRYFYNPKNDLAFCQVCFPISLRASIIPIVAFIRSWALVASCLAFHFLINQHLFLLKALIYINLSNLPFQ
jgi:hypothetical protein